MGTITLAAHQVSLISSFAPLVREVVFIHINNLLFTQVMIQTLMMCTVWGEPLAQTAQSFMPEFLYGMNRNLAKVSSSHFY